MRTWSSLIASVLMPLWIFGSDGVHEGKKVIETYEFIQKEEPLPMTMTLLVSADEIKERVNELGKELAKKFQNKQPVMIGILSGATIFHADLVRAMNIPMKTDFIRVKSYEGTETTGKVREVLGLKTSVKGEHVILVEDIVDTGTTMDYLLTYFKKLDPASITVVSLLAKPEKLLSQFKGIVVVDHIGFNIPSEFVIGYGLDFDGFCRELPAIYQVQTIQGKPVKVTE